ncbi:MAG: acetyl-CoA carboxylase biotin carboxyl carrier protein [Planctomycetota bacterium]|jgi:acetyl-CoA carboxylase biotin carboxyl carrier protein
MAESDKKVGDVFDIDRIRKLIELMKEHDLGEIDLRQDDQRIRLCGAGHGHAFLAPPMISAAPAAAPAGPASSPASTPAAADSLDGPHIAVIKSPMVGTFYSKPNPNAKDFVEVGSAVQNDTVICIIEAMKVFNEINAEMRGKIVQVLVRNEEAVDFGKPLFKIDTRG